MAVEAKRGCGFRQVGGLYIVAGEFWAACDRLPFALTECEHCGRAYKQTRSFYWVKPESLLRGDHMIDGPGFWGLGEKKILCPEDACTVCRPRLAGARAGLMWVGQASYSPESFGVEATELGISKRINAIPKGLEIGITRIYLAHPQACVPVDSEGKRKRHEKGPGIIMAFTPQRFERIVKQSEHDAFNEAMRDLNPQADKEDDKGYEAYVRDYWKSQPKPLQQLYKDYLRGITFVPVPDDDPDHNAKGKAPDEDA